MEDLAQRLCDRIRHLTLETNNADFNPVTISVGVAVYPEHGRNSEDLLKSADEALYQAKAQGKDRALLAGTRPKGSVQYLDFN